MATTPRGEGGGVPRRLLRGADNPLVRAVGRVRATVLAKLLIAFVGTVALLVVLGIVGLQVIGQSNATVGELGRLQLRAAAYRHLQTQGFYVLQLLNIRDDPCLYATCKFGHGPSFADAASRLAIDRLINSALSGLDQETDDRLLGFTPPHAERVTLDLIQQDYVRLSEEMRIITGLDGLTAGETLSHGRLQSIARPIANNLRELTNTLARETQDATDALIRTNRSAFIASQNLIGGVAVGSIILALLLGYVLSWSIVGPIRSMQSRLAAIASGDFSGHALVSNRDELGVLATNLNQMNDELGRLYGELETASRHKSEFLASMSHELRTPLNAIIGFSQVLKEQMFGELNPAQAGYVDDVLTSGQHLLALINDVLDLAKVEAGRMELQPTTFDLPDVLEGSMAMIRERAIRQGVTLASEIDPSVGLLEADERKVKQILFNLLSNAVKFTPRGEITLAATVVEGHVEISVRDTGVGISAEDQIRLFEEFYQAGSGRTQEGTGLGLALTRRLIELHHGRLSVKSEPGVGSTFTFTLPLVQQRTASPEALR